MKCNSLFISSSDNMKKLFIELLLIIISGIGLIFLFELLYSNYKSPVDYKITSFEKQKNKITGIIIGNSHLDAIGTPKIFGNDSCTINLSMGGHDLFHMLLFIEKCVPEAPNLKYVLLGLDYELIGYNFNVENQAWKDRLYYSFNKNIYDKSLSNIFMANLNFFKANRDLAYIFWKPENSAEQNKFIPPGLEIKSNDGCKKRALEHSLYKFKKKLISENLVYLKKIVLICKKNKVNIIFVNTPKTSCYTSFYKPEVISAARNEYVDFCKKNQLTYVDLFNSTFFNDTDFIDYDHLNEKGIQKLIGQIREPFN